jgi:hypothetical protein
LYLNWVDARSLSRAHRLTASIGGSSSTGKYSDPLLQVDRYPIHWLNPLLQAEFLSLGLGQNDKLVEYHYHKTSGGFSSTLPVAAQGHLISSIIITTLYSVLYITYLVTCPALRPIYCMVMSDVEI